MLKEKIYTIGILILMGITWNCQSSKAISSSNIETQPTRESLQKQRAKLLKLAKMDTVCHHSSDWKIIGIGSKACGGPTEYIAYHKDSDEKQLLHEIKIYNQAMAKFNQLNGIISDCMLKVPPQISCKNGKLVLL